jgi:hypothetical protein
MDNDDEISDEPVEINLDDEEQSEPPQPPELPNIPAKG